MPANDAEGMMEDDEGLVMNDEGQSLMCQPIQK